MPRKPKTSAPVSAAAMPPADGRKRIMLFDVTPSVDAGRFPAKRVVGDQVLVEVDLVCDGHDKLSGVVLYRKRDGRAEGVWKESRLVPLVNDRWTASFPVTEMGVWEFAVLAWADDHASWLWGAGRKLQAAQATATDFLDGAVILEASAAQADKNAATLLRTVAAELRKGGDPAALFARAGADDVVAAAWAGADRSRAQQSDRNYQILVDPVRAGFSAWYEMFPRSCGPEGKHGTFAGVQKLLPYVADMGFDVLYLPPIHPIGMGHRKGPNNTLKAGPGDPGSPWAIGGRDGGHRDFHPELGTEADFVRLVKKARALGLEVALDIAFQASPDHPYVAQHPEWFTRRADGSIQYAENPPKKYQDIYPFNLSGEGYQSLWQELLQVFLLWIDRGVNIFRVDNPHTKSLPFWQWCIDAIKAKHPQTIFLAEAFTRPKVMYALAKVGFSQSYTYYTWRTTGAELTEYMGQLTAAPVSDFMRPNFWPNTPDILPEHLQFGARSTFIARVIMAGTLTSNYGIYGPAYELLENVPRAGAEEYVDNEKYQLRTWARDNPDSLSPVLTSLNRIRKENVALQSNRGLVFHPTGNPHLLCYSKSTREHDNTILTVVNLDPTGTQAGWLQLDLEAMGLAWDRPFQVADQLNGSAYQWQGARNYVALDPGQMPAHIFKVTQT